MRKKTKQLLCTALSVVMLLGILPMQALATPAVDVGGMIIPQQVSDSAAETPPEPGMTVEPETEPTPGPSADPDAAPPAEEPPVKVTDSGTQPPQEEESPEEAPPRRAGHRRAGRRKAFRGAKGRWPHPLAPAVSAGGAGSIPNPYAAVTFQQSLSRFPLLLHD